MTEKEAIELRKKFMIAHHEDEGHITFKRLNKIKKQKERKNG